MLVSSTLDLSYHPIKGVLVQHLFCAQPLYKGLRELVHKIILEHRKGGLHSIKLLSICLSIRRENRHFCIGSKLPSNLRSASSTPLLCPAEPLYEGLRELVHQIIPKSREGGLYAIKLLSICLSICRKNKRKGSMQLNFCPSVYLPIGKIDPCP